MMQLKTYNLTEDGRIAPLPPSEMTPDWFTDKQVRWIDVTASETEEIERLLEPLDLHETVQEAFQATEARPEVIAFEKLLFLRLPFLGREGEYHSLRLLCGPTAIVSARTVPLVEIDRMATTLETGLRQLRPTVPALLIEIFEAVLREARPAALGLRDEINDLSNSLETNRDEINSADLHGLKRRASQLTCLIEDQLICLETLSAARSESLRISEVRDELRILITLLDKVKPVALRLEEQARELRQAYAGLLQETGNRRLNVLAVLSAIYLPSTLIAGIYGMNFDDIPITHIASGYWLVLSLMAALAAGQMAFFWYRGWFK